MNLRSRVLTMIRQARSVEDPAEARAGYLNMVCMMYSHWQHTGEDSGWIAERFNVAHTKDYILASAAMERIKARHEALSGNIDWTAIALDYWNEHHGRRF